MSSTNGKLHLAKWSLAMIVRNCAKDLDICLKSIAAYPDEIVIVNTGITEDEPGFKETSDVALSHGAKVFHFPWVRDFSKARNFSFSKCSHDVVMWLDSDDSVENPASLNQLIRNAFGSGTIEVMYSEYLYDFDQKGVCTTVLNRERIVNRRFFEWRAPIHEIQCEKYQVRGSGIPANFSRIVHRRRREDAHSDEALLRNLDIMEHNYLPAPQGLGDPCEERMVFYWAQTLMGLKRYEEALRKYLEYVPRSGSQPEIQQALGNASECCVNLGKLGEARALAYQAIERNPEAPTPYWFAAQANFKAGNMMLAAHYATICLKKSDGFNQEIVANPKVIFGGSALMAAVANYNQGKLALVEPLLKEAEKFYGKDEPGIVEMRANIAKGQESERLVSAFTLVADALEKEGRREDVRAIARSAPSAIRSMPDVARFQLKNRDPSRRTIAFFCPGGMPDGWGPELLSTGIGGSEEAVCYLSEQFAKSGWNVEVYAPCKRQRWHDVEWYPVEEFSGDDDENMIEAMVVWRWPLSVMPGGVKAKATYLWLHDMPMPHTWAPDAWNAYDGIFVLSDFHKKVYDFIPNEKKIASANGIPIEGLVPLDQLTNEPTRMIYASDPLRGLETVLLWWDHIRKAVPEAVLDVYYGFHPTLMAAAKNNDPYSRGLAAQIKRIDELRQQPGVNWLGFVGHEQLHKGMARAGIWLYPTCFPEIHCITGVKMQAHGVVPVTVNDFALKETVLYGDKLDLKMDNVANQRMWADAVIAQALNPWSKEKRLEMATAIRATCGWDKIAAQWLGIFEKDLAANRPHRVYPRNRLDLMCAAT